MPRFQSVILTLTKQRLCFQEVGWRSPARSGPDIVSVLPSQSGGNWSGQVLCHPSYPHSTPSDLLASNHELAIRLGWTKPGTMETGKRVCILIVLNR